MKGPVDALGVVKSEDTRRCIEAGGDRARCQLLCEEEEGEHDPPPPAERELQECERLCACMGNDPQDCHARCAVCGER